MPFAIAFIFFFTNSTEFAKATNNNSIVSEKYAAEDTIKGQDGKIVLIENVDELEGDVYYVVEKLAKFQGQLPDAFRKFISKNLKYPAEAKKKGVSGRVFIQFDIDTKGSVRNAKVVRGADPLLDAEALRVVNLSPKWTPAEDKGEKVNVRFTFPIVFSLQ